MSRCILRPMLTLLRILVIAGALASVLQQPQTTSNPISFSLVSFHEGTTGTIEVASRNTIRLALTAITLSLL